VIPHYDQSIRDDFFIRGIKSLLDQEFQDFEVLLYHDGPISRPIPDIYKELGDRCRLTITKKRKNDWGHSNRDDGIKNSNGDYIIHFNPDNVLYPFALKNLYELSIKPEAPGPAYTKRKSDILVFPIRMIGVECDGKFHWRTFDPKSAIVITGYPAIPQYLDAMQVVMSYATWHKIGYWYDKSKNSDGHIYSKAIREYGARYTHSILGEHW